MASAKSTPVKTQAWKGDLVWLGLLLLVLVLMLVPPMAETYRSVNRQWPYASAFVKFMLLASMGELLAARLRGGRWQKPAFLAERALVWGFLGMVIALAFALFLGGVPAAARQGLLPETQSSVLNAFITSVLINLLFAPGMMAFHRLSDAYFDLRAEGRQRPALNEIAARISWGGFIRTVVGKTIPFFWIPAHTITFLLPADYRVLMAAMLSIALGLLMALVKPR